MGRSFVPRLLALAPNLSYSGRVTTSPRWTRGRSRATVAPQSRRSKAPGSWMTGCRKSCRPAASTESLGRQVLPSMGERCRESSRICACALSSARPTVPVSKVCQAGAFLRVTSSSCETHLSTIRLGCSPARACQIGGRWALVSAHAAGASGITGGGCAVRLALRQLLGHHERLVVQLARGSACGMRGTDRAINKRRYKCSEV